LVLKTQKIHLFLVLLLGQLSKANSLRLLLMLPPKGLVLKAHHVLYSFVALALCRSNSLSKGIRTLNSSVEH